MVYGYARVSTLDQDPGLQLSALKAAGCERIIDENGSGGDPNRPKLAKLLLDLKTGDELVVWKLDRLARTLKQLVDVGEQLRERGVELRSLQESIDTRTIYGKAMYQLLGIFAELERGMIRERVTAGIAKAQANGTWRGGRPAKLSSEQVAHVREMIAAGKSVGETARILKVGRATIWRATHTTSA